MKSSDKSHTVIFARYAFRSRLIITRYRKLSLT